MNMCFASFCHVPGHRSVLDEQWNMCSNISRDSACAVFGKSQSKAHVVVGWNTHVEALCVEFWRGFLNWRTAGHPERQRKLPV